VRPENLGGNVRHVQKTRKNARLLAGRYATYEPGGTSNVSAFVNKALRGFRRVGPTGQFVWKFVAHHETFSEFQRLYL
jgi:hypothetical protein